MLIFHYFTSACLALYPISTVVYVDMRNILLLCARLTLVFYYIVRVVCLRGLLFCTGYCVTALRCYTVFNNSVSLTRVA